MRAAPLLQQGSTDCTFCEYIHVYVYVSRVGLPSSCSTLKLDGARVYRTHLGAIQLHSFSDVQDTRRLPCAFVCASLSLSVDTPTHKPWAMQTLLQACKEVVLVMQQRKGGGISTFLSLHSFVHSTYLPELETLNVNPKISVIRIGINR